MSRNLILLIWRFGLEFLRLFGRENGLCADIQVIKSARLATQSDTPGEMAGITGYKEPSNS